MTTTLKLKLHANVYSKMYLVFWLRLKLQVNHCCRKRSFMKKLSTVRKIS